jgi:hypothetical protein
MLPETNSPEVNDRGELAALKNQVFALLIALIVVSGTLTVFLYRQVSLTGKDIASGHQVAAMINQNEANLATFINRLVDYGQRHPDYQQVLKKYGIAPVPGVPAVPKK